MDSGVLSMMARWNRPLADGTVRSTATVVLPALSPMIVTCAGSPPNFPMLRLTQRSDSSWSMIPKFPDSPRSSLARNPSAPSRYMTLTTTMLVAASLDASYANADGELPMYDPPWKNTSTGNPEPSELLPGAYMFNVRQSSF